MSTKAKRHTHKYYKAKLPYHTVWACALKDCTHHMPPHMSDLVIGKGSLCWKCENELIMDDRSMAMDKPLCEDCDPSTFDVNAAVEALTELGLVNKVTGE